MITTLYRGATALGSPFISLLLRKRLAWGKEDAARIGERRGIAGQPRPPGPLVWIHAASIGESLSALPLIDRLLADRPQLALLMTTGTVTSARLMTARLPAGVVHQFVPVDRTAYVRRFLDHWRPELVLWIESELWPNLIGEILSREVPIALINARMSSRSYARWRWLQGSIRRLLAGFALCLAQSETHAERFRALGANNARSLGNLKFASPPLPFDEADYTRLRAAIGNRPRWLAASTHAGEEQMAADAHFRLRDRHPDLLTIIVPRHPERSNTIAAQLRAAGHCIARRSAGEMPDDATDIYLADTLGELGLFYRITGIAFVGGSLVPHGGQNILEPAKLDCAILHGPHMTNSREIALEMDQGGAAQEISDSATLASAVDALLTDTAHRRRYAVAAAEIAAGKAGILDAVTEALEPLLVRLPEVTLPHARP